MSGGLLNSFDAPSPTVVGGRYRLVTELGRGGMGVVHRARDERTGRDVALKLVPKASVVEWQRLVREGRALAALEHPNIVAVLDAGEAGHEAFLAMALVNGRSLADRLRVGPLPIAEACAITEGVARALAYAHAHGVLHRDVKPANVLLEQDGTPRLCDFGLARQAGDGRMTTTGELVGTPSFMAPEQAQGASAATGPWTDSWGLGALLYALLTGRPPFEASSVMSTILQVLEAAPATPSSLRPGVPAALEALCLRCLEKEPARRPTAQQVADALVGLKVAEGRARPRAARPHRRGVDRSVLIGAVVIAVGVALVAALALVGGGASSERAGPDETAPVAPVSTRAGEPPTTPVVPEAEPEPEPDALLARALAHLDAQELDPSAAALRRAVALRPARTPLLRRVVSAFGLRLADHGDDAAAVRLVGEALGATPLAAEAWNALAARHASRGEFAAARRASDRALTLAPARSATRAWALSHGGAWTARPDEVNAAAARTVEEAVEASPDDLDALFGRGYFRLALPGRERVDLDRVAAGDDPALAAMALASIGSVLLDVDATARACERDPGNPASWAAHGYVLGSKGKLPDARASLDRALALDPRDVGSLKHRAVVRLQLDDARGALADVDALLRLWPDSIDGFTWRVRAAANERLGRRDAAIADLEVALLDRGQRAAARADLVTLRGPDAADDEPSPSATTAQRLARADLLRERGEVERAQRALEQVVREQPSSVAWGVLALARVQAGDVPGARAALAQCAAPSGHHALALTLLRDPASIAAADAAIDDRPDDPMARLARAIISRSFAERAGAAPHVRAGLESRSTPPSGWSRRTLEALDRWSRGP